VLLLERERESVDDGAEDLEELRHPVVPLRLVHEPVKYIVDLEKPVKYFVHVKKLVEYVVDLIKTGRIHFSSGKTR
jgi:hypothetical protein